MASAYNKLTAEQVRANYREQFFVADLQAPKILSAMEGDPDGLVHKDKLEAPLKVRIVVWDDRPTSPFQPPDVLMMEWYVAGEWLSIAPAEDIPFDEGFPLEKDIPLVIFEKLEGRFEFRYRVKSWNGTERPSPAAPVTIDRTGPIWAEPAKAVIDIEEPLITDEVLARDKGVYCVIPDYIETNRDVLLLVAWLDKVPAPGEDITQFIVLTRPLPLPDRRVLVEEQHIRKYGSSTQYAVAFLVDKAGNRGEMSLPATIPVALGTLPSDLLPCTVPLAADGLIDRKDAAVPTRVRIEEYTGWNRDDGIVVKWGTELARTSVGAHLQFPLEITVPWAHMSDEYDFTSATHVQSVEVDYTVLRGDYPFSSPGAIAVNTDFAIPGPTNPDPDPNPINPDLNPVVFKSSSDSATELTKDDIGRKADAYIELYDDAEDGDTLTLYYNNVVVTATNNPYSVDGSETPNEVINIEIPWPDIERTPAMKGLPIYYTVTHKDFNNSQESDRTLIDVLVEDVDLPEPEFLPPSDFIGGIVNCNSLKRKSAGSTEWGIFVHIPKYVHLKHLVEVSLSWQTYELDNITPIAGTTHVEDVIVSPDQEENGIDWFVPYEKCLKPSYKPPISGGLGRVKYAMPVHGEEERSEEVIVVIGVFEGDGGSGNGHCVIPRP